MPYSRTSNFPVVVKAHSISKKNKSETFNRTLAYLKIAIKLKFY